jgi:glycine/D-amino acid oxidase-like deaminating enzyme
VPLIHRAYELWRELENTARRPMMNQTGALYVGPPEAPMVLQAASAAGRDALATVELTREQGRKRFPAIHLPAGEVALFEPSAAVLFPEARVVTCLRLARALGASLHLDERVEGWSADRDGVVVTTPLRRYRSEALVLCVGSWAPDLLAMEAPLELELQIPVLFDPGDRAGLVSRPRLRGHAATVTYARGGQTGPGPALAASSSFVPSSAARAVARSDISTDATTDSALRRERGCGS